MPNTKAKYTQASIPDDSQGPKKTIKRKKERKYATKRKIKIIINTTIYMKRKDGVKMLILVVDFFQRKSNLI